MPTVYLRIVWRLLAMAMVLCAGATGSQSGTNVLLTAPSWTLQDLDGRSVHLSDFHGKVVLLDFWATWCPPCRKEILGLIELQKKYGSQGLVVVGISLDEDSRLVQPFAQKLHINYVVVSGTPLVAASYGNVSVIPSTFVINKEGKIVAVHEGFVETGSLEADIKPLFYLDGPTRRLFTSYSPT